MTARKKDINNLHGLAQFVLFVSSYLPTSNADRQENFCKNSRSCKGKLFESKKVRSHWDSEKESWYFSVTDVIEILTGSGIPKRYWSDLEKKLVSEGSEVYEKIVPLKMEECIYKTKKNGQSKFSAF